MARFGVKGSPNEVFVEVHVVALNPIDYHQCDSGFPPIPAYPAVIGFDVSGIVAKVGTNVTTAPSPGSRVIAMATSYYHDGSPEYGTFHKYTLIPSERVIALPDTISFGDGAVIPAASITALTAWTSIGIALTTRFTPEDRQAVLIWGGASIVGSFTIQTARTLGFTVYATASPKHHDYLRKLGAQAMFDYKEESVVGQILVAMKKDDTKLHTAHCVVHGGLQPTLDVLREAKGDGAANVAHSPVLPEGHPTLKNTEIVFNYPPLDAARREKHLFECFHGWVEAGLKSGHLVPSPRT